MSRIWTRIVPLIAAAVLGAAGGAAPAADASWSVAQMSGKVTITLGRAQPVSLTKGTELPAGGILTTGPSSRVLLVRGQQTMAVGANAAIAIPTSGTDPQFTTILEDAGLVDFSVDKQTVQHFAVETPYLAAVVKGTEFSVDVSPGGGTVKVTRGIVEVTDLATGEVVDLLIGQSATVRADGTLALAGSGPRPAIVLGTPRLPNAGLNFGALTGGAGIGGSVGAGQGGVRANANAGPVSIQASAGGNGLSVGAGVGGLGVGASAGGDGVSVDAGGADVSVGSGGVQADIGSTGVTVDSGGVQVDVGGTDVGVGTGGVNVDIGDIHVDIGLGH